MPTNDERRRVASVLLLLNAVSKRFSKKDSWDALRMAVGTYEDAPFAGCVTFARLAELVDPDVTRNVPVSQIAGLLDADLGRMVDAMRDLYDL